MKRKRRKMRKEEKEEEDEELNSTIKIKRMATGWTVQDRIPMGGARFSALVQTGPRAPPSLLYNGYRVFPGGKERPRREADLSPASGTVVKKEYSYTSTPSMGRTACTEPQRLYNGALYLYLYLHSPYRPYGLYRTSVPVQRCTLTLPIPLLPL